MSRPGGLSPEDKAALKAAEEARRQHELDEKERRRRELEEQQAQARVTPQQRDVQAQQRYREGKLSATQARLYVEKRLAAQGVEEQPLITEAPEGYYYESAQKVQEYNSQVLEYNQAVREYRSDAVRAFTELGAEQPRAPYGYGTAQERDRDILLPGEAQPQQQPVRSVEATQGPISPFISEISPAGPELGQPADTRPIYSEGREPTFGEQLLGVAQIPSQLFRGVEAIGRGGRERLPQTGAYLLPMQASYALEGLAGGGANLVDPMTYLGLPGAVAMGATYLTTAGWDRISADVSRTLGGYKESRMANPMLLYRDLGYQLGAMYGFKAVTGVAARAARATGSALGGLPGDVIGSKGLAVISGESPIGFRQAGQVLRQRSAGLGRDVLGAEGLAAFGGEALPLKQLIQVVKQRGSLGSDVLGSRGLAQIGGAAPYPLRQSLEVWARRASLANLPGEALGGGIAAVGADPALLPIKQLIQVVKQRGSLGSDVLGPTTMGTRGYSLKAMARFFTMPGAVEPFTGVFHRGPAFTGKDISGFLRIKAREQAGMNAAKVEAFMTREFAPRGAPAGSPVLLQADVRQLVKVGQGVGALDVFPYEVIAFPPRDEFIAREELRRVERPAFVPRQETALKQTLRDAAKLRVGEKPSLLVDQAQQLRQIFKPMAKPRVRQPQALKSAQLQLPGLKAFQEQQQAQRQRQMLMGALAFKPPGQRLRLPQTDVGPGLGGRRPRHYKGERRTYPVRDPLSFLDELLEPKKGKRRRPRGLRL